MKKYLFILVVFTMLFSQISLLFSDNSEDSLLDKGNFRDRTQYFMKFRGDVSIALAYYWGVNKGVADSKNVFYMKYTQLDFTNTGDPSNRYHDDGIGRKIGSTWGGLELKLYGSYSFIAPFLTSDFFLFKDNNIKMTFYGELSPVSMNAGMGIVWTPIAFLNFGAGFLIGSGWSFAGLFNGLGRNIPGAPVRVEPFLGPYMNIWFNTTLQFDIAAVMPKSIKRWTHIVMVVKPEFQYKAILNLDDKQPYLWEADDGENMAGFVFKPTFLLGYQIPIIEDDTGENRTFLKLKHNRFMITTGFLTVIDTLSLTHYSDSPMSNGWGSDFCFIEFGPILRFDMPNNLYLNIFFFWKNDKVWTKETAGNLFYQDRIYEDWAVYFRRVAFIFGWNF